jgi:hypothetical protein
MFEMKTVCLIGGYAMYIGVHQRLRNKEYILWSWEFVYYVYRIENPELERRRLQIATSRCE